MHASGFGDARREDFASASEKDLLWLRERVSSLSRYLGLPDQRRFGVIWSIRKNDGDACVVVRVFMRSFLRACVRACVCWETICESVTRRQSEAPFYSPKALPKSRTFTVADHGAARGCSTFVPHPCAHGRSKFRKAAL